MTHDTINQLLEQRAAAFARGDADEADRLTRQLRELATGASPPVRRAARRVMSHNQRRDA